jgi:hypothetical protein
MNTNQDEKKNRQKAREDARRAKTLASAKEKISILADNPTFQDDIKYYRNKWTIPGEGFSNAIEAEAWREKEIYYKLNRGPELDSDLAVLAHRHSLSSAWLHSLELYLLYNEIEKELPTELARVGMHTDETNGLMQLSIYIDKHTVLEDIRAIWPLVERYQERLPNQEKQKQQHLKNLHLYQRAYELRHQKKKYKEIADILSDEFDLVLSDIDAQNLVKRYKDKIGQ